MSQTTISLNPNELETLIRRVVREEITRWMNWEDFEAELDRAEAAGELPD